MERDQQQLLHENNFMSDQLYQLKSKNLGGGEDGGAHDGDKVEGLLSFEVGDRVQKDKMVELLKRNHDVMMEKYETYRQRNELLEKKALDKENLYVVIKGENDKLSNSVYQLKRQVEDLRQERQLLDSKYTSADSQLKSVMEKASSFQTKNEQIEGQMQVVSEQLELV